MIIHIDENNKWLWFDQLSEIEEDQLKDKFSCKHPRHKFIDKGGWDGYIRKFDVRHQRLPKPFLYELLKFCKALKIPYDIIDHRSELKSIDVSKVNKNFLYGIELEDYQVNAIKVLAQHEDAILQSSTGSGKTEIMAGIAKLLNMPTVILANQRIVIEQVKERLELRDVINEVGMFYYGSTPSNQQIIVGSIQSLMSPPKSLAIKKPDHYKSRVKRSKIFRSLVQKSKIIMVDECDAVVNQLKKAFDNFKGRWRIGFSATPYDSKKPLEKLTLTESLGSVVHKINRRLIEKTGRIIPVKFNFITFGDKKNRANKDAFDIAEKEQLIENSFYHNLISTTVKAFPKDKTLILVDTCNVEALGKKLEDVIPNSKFIFGKTSKSKRKKYIKAFEDNQLTCLIGGKIIKRGLDIHGGTDNLIICGGGKLASNFDQSVGRALRINKRGWARVFVFICLNNQYLYRHGRAQLKTALSMGYKCNLHIEGKKTNPVKFLRSGIR